MSTEKSLVWVGIRDTGGRKGFRVRFRLDGKLKELYFNGLSKRSKGLAQDAAKHIEGLLQAKKHGANQPPDATAWANRQTGTILASLQSWGLASASNPKLLTDEGRLLGPFLTSYIDGRTDVKQTTRTNYLQTRRLLVEHFGEMKELSTITPADAERFQRWMISRKEMAEATVSKHSKRAKTMLHFAVKDRLLVESPFDEVKGGDESSKSKFFITQEVAKKVLAACPSVEWRLIFSLARFGGLRVPSELSVLKWTDILWDQDRFRIDSPKTGERFCSLFPEVRKALEDAFDEASEGSVYCLPKVTRKSNLGTALERILGLAGVNRWDKLYTNLRSTRRTELQESFPDHVVNKWLGHSGKVAEKYYLQVTDSHFEAGAKFGSHAGSHIPTDTVSIPTKHKTTVPSFSLGTEVYRWLGNPSSMTPTGVEPVLPP
jgi:integrase